MHDSFGNSIPLRTVIFIVWLICHFTGFPLSAYKTFPGKITPSRKNDLNCDSEVFYGLFLKGFPLNI